MNTEAIGSIYNRDLFVPETERVGLHVRNLTVKLNKREICTDKNNKSWWKRICSNSKKIDVNEGKKEEEEEEEIGRSNKKLVLNNISLDLEQGKVLAILGSSGSGKTTLLNTLASRMNFSKSKENPFQFEGMVHYTQDNPNISYLLQEDLFMPGLTVREILRFTAKLKLPNSSKQERTKLIDYLFDSLNLRRIENTIINDFKFNSTLSGGEKRRVSLAIQLLTKPSILFLDEPTTGLDSNTSINLIQTVKDLAQNFGITIILTIHQPRFEILDIVDEICLLARGGSMLFTGSIEEGHEYFKSLDLENEGNVEQEANFADFLLSISSINKTMSKEVELKTQARVNKLMQCWQNSQKLLQIDYYNSFDSGSSIFKQKQLHKLTFFREVWILMERCTLLTLRDSKSMFILHFIMTFLALICGWCFYKPGGSLAGIRSITSTLYVCCEVLGFTPLLYEIERLCAIDGKFFVKEYKEGIHSISGFLLARRLVKLILEDIPITIVWSVITFYMWGLNGSSNFGIFFINNFLIYTVGMGTAMVCFMAGNYEFGKASLISNLFYQLQNSACGYFVNAKTMPVYVRWVKYLANFWYGFGSLISNQFTNFEGDCPYERGSDKCFEFTGDFVLDNLGYSKNWFAVPLVVNLCWFLFFYTMSGIILWYQSRLKIVRVVKPIEDKFELLKLNQIDTDRMISEVTANSNQQDMVISLRNISLTLRKNFWKNTIFRKPHTAKQILKDIESSFKPGVNAIMGPSGCGKTSLLNFITGRTKYSTINATGDVTLNGQSIPFELLKKITTYVVQDDNVLIPSLTVKETLWYQAKLRLDPSQHQFIPVIVNELIRKTGLSDVANIPIGSSLIKGISGGEKRRVSIAIQLLNDPKILLLDEPTSGLDSFTSSSIISLLNEIAKNENKTIILTIHQPKYEIFAKFDNILLLSDGYVIYDGSPSGLIEHFAEMGYKPSNNKINFADYILDVISTKGFGENHDNEPTSLKMIHYWKAKQEKLNGTATLSGIPTLSIVNEKDLNKNSFKGLIKKPQSFKVAFHPILERQFKVIIRSHDLLFSRVVQIVGMGIINALFFAPMKHNPESISNRLGLFQTILNLLFIGFISNFSGFQIEKITFYQEYEDNTYSPITFMICYFINELPFEIICSFFFSIFVVLVIGLPRNGGMFFSMLYFSIMLVNCGESVGMMFTIIFDHMGLAFNIVGAILTLFLFSGGTMSLEMPDFFKGINYIAPLKYSVNSLAKLSFEGESFSCSPSAKEDEVSNCLLSNGKEILKQYNLGDGFKMNFIAVAIIVIVYRLIAFGILELKLRYLRK